VELGGTEVPKRCREGEIMLGHAKPDEEIMIRALEAQIDPLQSPVEDMIRLGQLYLCPAHDADGAMTIFKQVLEREPRHPWATYWLAYVYLWEQMDRDSLLLAKAMLESWLGSTAASSSGAEAKAAIFQRLAQVRDDPTLHDLSDAERATLLEESVRLAPHWVINRWYLARAYITLSRTTDAAEQLEAAQANIVPKDAAWDAADELFENDVTGCYGSTYLADEIRRMLGELRQQQ
jgi:hypothetical protein